MENIYFWLEKIKKSKCLGTFFYLNRAHLYFVDGRHLITLTNPGKDQPNCVILGNLVEAKSNPPKNQNIIRCSRKYWIQYHREDGPAMFTHVSEYYYMNGKPLSEKEILFLKSKMSLIDKIKKI